MRIKISCSINALSLQFFVFKKEAAKNFWKSLQYPLGGLYRVFTNVLIFFSDVIPSATDSAYPKLKDRSGLVLKLRE